MKLETRVINWRGVKPFKVFHFAVSYRSYTDIDEKTYHVQVGYWEFRFSIVGKGALKL